MDRFQNILLVGCGNMAGAMLTGWLAGGIPASRFTVVDPSGKRTTRPPCACWRRRATAARGRLRRSAVKGGVVRNQALYALTDEDVRPR